ncbi:MAG: UDP-glucuronate 4-epimerase [Kiritimatiellia bacterium]|jgi:UDP-glucuronate 4-epimerase
MTILVTGAAGFIGSHVALRLLQQGHTVVGLDNLCAYYDVSLKRARLHRLQSHGGFRFLRLDIVDRDAMSRIFAGLSPRVVLHFAGQPGVRHALDHPHDYVDTNLVGFVNVLEGCRHAKVEHLVYASSSSVYGAQVTMPQREDSAADQPMSLYAATKRANELMAYAYSHLHATPMTGLRLFTVYGPWGRPDMALWRFALSMSRGEPIDVYNHGQMVRDLTYIDDVVDDVIELLHRAPDGAVPHRVVNVGGGQPVTLDVLISELEGALGVTAIRNMLQDQPGDMRMTWADIAALEGELGPRSRVPLRSGVRSFVQWFRSYHGVYDSIAPTLG